MVEYSFLKEHAHFAHVLGVEIYSEWKQMYDFQGKTRTEVIETVKSRAVDDCIPVTMIAHKNGELFGSVTLKTHEGTDFPELSPWLAGVFVRPQFRGKGIGIGLVNYAEQIARVRFGVTQLFLYTSSARKLYERLGYTIFSQTEKDGKIVEYMEKQL